MLVLQVMLASACNTGSCELLQVMFSRACGADSVGDAGSAGEAGSAGLVPLVMRVLLVLLVMLILLASAGDTGFFWLMLIVSRMLAGRFWCCGCCL